MHSQSSKAQNDDKSSKGKQAESKSRLRGASPNYNEPPALVHPAARGSQLLNAADSRTPGVGNGLPPKPVLVNNSINSSGNVPQIDQNMNYDSGAHKESGQRGHNQPSTNSPGFEGSYQAMLPPRPPPTTSNYSMPPSAPRADHLIAKTELHTSNIVLKSAPGDRSGNGNSYRGGYKNKGRRDVHSQGNHPGFGSQSKQPFHTQNNFGHGHARPWRRDGLSNHHGFLYGSQYCNNKQTLPYEYNECGCGECANRNRSIWVRVKTDETDSKDLQTRLKFGLGARFGDVEEVYPVPHKYGNAFIMRFQSEDSVPVALGLGNIEIPEKDLSLLIGPAHHSKWILKSYIGEHRRKLQHEQALQHQGMVQHPFNQGWHPGAGYGTLPPVARGPQHQFRSFSQYPMHPTPRGFVLMQRGGPATGYHQSSIPNFPPAFVPAFAGPQHLYPQRSQEQYPSSHGNEKQVAKSAECKSQSKPPSEEALEDVESTEQQRALTPQSQLSQTSSHKAKVSLPSVTPPKLDQGKQVICKEVQKVDPAKSPTPKQIQVEKGDDESSHYSQAPKPGGGQCDRVPSNKQPFSIAQSSQTSALSKATAAGKHSRAPSIFTEEEIKWRKQAWDRIPMPLDPRKIKQTPVTVKLNNNNVAKNTEPAVQNLPSNTSSETPGPAQFAPADTDMISMASNESKTISISSTPSIGSPHRNYTNSLFNSDAKVDSNDRNRYEVSQSSSVSPARSAVRDTEKESGNYRPQNAGGGEPEFLNVAAVPEFTIAGNGRGTIRVGHHGERGHILDEISSQGRGRTAAKKWSKRNKQASRGFDLAMSSQEQQGTVQTEAETSAPPTGTHVRAQATSQTSLQSSHMDAESGTLTEAGASEKKATGNSSLKIPKKRKNHKKLNTLFLREPPNEQDEGLAKDVKSVKSLENHEALTESSTPASSTIEVKGTQKDSPKLGSATSENLAGPHISVESIASLESNSRGVTKHAANSIGKLEKEAREEIGQSPSAKKLATAGNSD
ncbi:hypothetical protein QQS21_006092 [Conoideocrella luteorostrata]|uniref:Uncharacterized protein n=1 Tax=Conoideocrella luteorostrata TaxID=1105319 RepID=A0AAJ0CP97_9HYPO|nr:hypothetical protein QQS21_006092 [Conoideocrella luteorostrata]